MPRIVDAPPNAFSCTGATGPAHAGVAGVSGSSGVVGVTGVLGVVGVLGVLGESGPFFVSLGTGAGVGATAVGSEGVESFESALPPHAQAPATRTAAPTIRRMEDSTHPSWSPFNDGLACR